MEINKDIFKDVEAVAKQNHLTTTEVMELLKGAFVKAFTKKIDPDAELEFEIDETKNTFKFFNNSKFVIEDEVSEYPQAEITLKDAKKIDPNVEVGDMVRDEIDIANYSRQDNQLVTQLFRQGIREAKKGAIYAKHKGLVGEMVEAVVKQIGRQHAVLELMDGTEAFMPPQHRNMKDKMTIGSHVRVYVEEVLEEAKGSQIIVSNGSVQIVKRVLEVEVPEIADGTVELVSISRVAGIRSKIAVRTTNENVDPVGAVIGAQGARINTITEKLDGERIDIIKWSGDINEFITNAMAPAKVIAVQNKEGQNGHKIVITPNKHQTLAIGKGGINARLAVELTKTRIDVMSVEEALEVGLAYEMNGNLTNEEIAIIESGERLQRRPARRHAGMSSGPRPQFDDLDDELIAFNAEGNDLPESFSSSTTDYALLDDNDIDVQELQDDFEFSDDLDMADIIDDFDI